MSATITQVGRFGDSVAQDPSQVFTLGTPTVAGHAVLLMISCVTKTRTLTGIIDSATQTWTHIDGGGGSTAGFCDCWWFPGSASLSTFQLDYSGTTKVQCVFYEIAGLAGTVNAHHTTNNTTAGTTAGDSVTTTGDCFIILGLGGGSAVTAVSPSPFAIDENTGGGVGIVCNTASAEEVSAGTYSPSFTMPSQISTTTIVALDVAGGGGGGPTRHDLLLTGAGA